MSRKRAKRPKSKPKSRRAPVRKTAATGKTEACAHARTGPPPGVLHEALELCHEEALRTARRDLDQLKASIVRETSRASSHGVEPDPLFLEDKPFTSTVHLGFDPVLDCWFAEVSLPGGPIRATLSEVEVGEMLFYGAFDAFARATLPEGSYFIDAQRGVGVDWGLCGGDDLQTLAEAHPSFEADRDPLPEPDDEADHPAPGDTHDLDRHARVTAHLVQ